MLGDVFMFRQRKPTSPGEILKEEFLNPLGITQKTLADHIGCDYKVINRIINGRASVTLDIATKLALAFETTPHFWLNAQMALDLWKTHNSKHRISSLIPHQKVA
jgi:addiction module HigA family antidote